MYIPSSHPFWKIYNLVVANPRIHLIELSYYSYTPQSIIDERSSFKLTRDQILNEIYIYDLFKMGNYGTELAIHSNVELYSGEVMHIPMVDMSTPSKAHLAKMRPFMGDNLFNSFSWFFSGRSFHGYGGYLLSHIDWTKLMGALLLSNQKDMKPIVDPRWIGHRLLAGYSALRWTRRTNFYINTPSYIENIYLDRENLNIKY